MTFQDIDHQIRRWATRHRLVLQTTGGEVRHVYLSSHAGECFQIWIEPPEDNHVALHAAGVDSRRDLDPPEDWYVSIETLAETLEEVYQTVTVWMLPSKRYFPDVQKT